MAFEEWKAALVTKVTHSENPSPSKSHKAQIKCADARESLRLAEILADVGDLMQSGEADGWPADDRRRWAQSITAIAAEWGAWEQLPAAMRGWITSLETQGKDA